MKIFSISTCAACGREVPRGPWKCNHCIADCSSYLSAPEALLFHSHHQGAWYILNMRKPNTVLPTKSWVKGDSKYPHTALTLYHAIELSSQLRSAQVQESLEIKKYDLNLCFPYLIPILYMYMRVQIPLKSTFRWQYSVGLISCLLCPCRD